LLGLLAFSACGVDDRGLVFEYSKLSSGGSPASAGNEAAGDSSRAANGGQGDAGEGGDETGGRLGGGGSSAEAGAASEHAGGKASAGGGGITSSGGVAGSGLGGNTIGGSGTGGNVGVAGSAGNAGAALSLPCGDLNQDLVDDCAQTLVQNSRFDAAVDGWDTEPSTNQVWDAANATGKPGSGSVKVSNTAAIIQAVGALAAGSHQCVPITPTTNYDFAARVLLPAGETGQAGVNVWLFDDDTCQGNLVTGNMPIIGGVAGSWTVLTGRVWVPGGVHSMWVRLVAIKPFGQPSLSVLIDDVLVAKR
jgi:hypothetical protein